MLTSISILFFSWKLIAFDCIFVIFISILLKEKKHASINVASRDGDGMKSPPFAGLPIHPISSPFPRVQILIYAWEIFLFPFPTKRSPRLDNITLLNYRYNQGQTSRQIFFFSSLICASISAYNISISLSWTLLLLWGTNYDSFHFISITSVAKYNKS